jgi:hypothetical protein
VSVNEDDQLVAGYLRRLEMAARELPADRRTELVEEITSHIAEARETASNSAESLPVRNILERLGDPADIVRAAAEPVASGAGAAGTRGRLGAREICAVLLLLVGGIVIPVVGWIAGVVLLWVSPHWRRREKVLGTLVWPGGLMAPVLLLFVGTAVTPTSVTVCTPGGVETGITTAGRRIVHHLAGNCTGTQLLPTWLALTLTVILMAAASAGPVVTAVWLLRRAGRTPARSAVEAAVAVPA